MVLTYRSNDLVGRVAVVTGGSRGEGAAISRLLAARGGRAIGVAADCTDFAAIERLRRQVEEEFGPADVLVALAGGFRRDGRDGDDVHLAVAANLTATFLTVKSFLPGMVERRSGTILTLPSVAVFARHVARAVREYGVHVDQAFAPSPTAFFGADFAVGARMEVPS